MFSNYFAKILSALLILFVLIFMARFIAVVGKEQLEKTALIQRLIPILKSRGYTVATIKEMPQNQTINMPKAAHDAYWHSEAGAETTVASTQNETILLIKRKLILNEMVPFVEKADFVILEGYENEKTLPRIVIADKAEEAIGLAEGLAIAFTGKIAESATEITKMPRLNIPIFDSNTEPEKLADLIEQKAFMMLPNLEECSKCHPLGECGYPTCYEYAKAIVSGKSKTICCPLTLKENMTVEVNGVRLPLKDFPQAIIQNALVGMFSSLHGAEEIRTLKIEVHLEE